MNDSPDSIDEAAESIVTAEASPDRSQVDLDRIERDLAGVEFALERLDAGTYWTDEITGESIADDVLIANPVARRAH